MDSKKLLQRQSKTGGICHVMVAGDASVGRQTWLAAADQPSSYTG